jgi:hypothetical protein
MSAPPTPVPEIVMIVVTPAEVAIVPVVTEVVVTEAVAAFQPTRLPSIRPSAPVIDSQMTTLVGVILAAGVVVALPMGLVFVAAIAYWIGRRL